MKLIGKLFILGFFLVFLLPVNSFAIDSSNIINFNITGNKNTWVNQLNIPSGKDLVINRIFTFDTHINDYIQFRDNGGFIIGKFDGSTQDYNNLNLIFAETFESYLTDDLDNFVVSGYLVNEGENYMSSGVSDGLGKSIFTQEFLQSWYIFKLAISIIIVFFVFLIKLMELPKKQFGFSTSNLSTKLIFGKGKK